MDIPMMGEKVAYKQTKEEIEEAEAMMEENKPEYNETGETKEILGYTCKKVDVEMGEDIFPIYYTNEINIEGNSNDSGQFPGIDGVILEYTVAQQGMVMKFTATEVKKQRVSDEMFGIPEDYTLKTAEEMEALFGM
jgi:GLPGLI family protein